VPATESDHAPTRVSEGFRAVFGQPGFRALFGSSLTSAIGASTSAIAVNWLVFHATHSTIDVAYVGLCGIVPGIALGLFAGVLADRYNRRNLMVTADLARMATMAALAALLYLAGFSLVLVLAAMVIVYSFSALFNPASQAILPRIVDAGTLEEANGALSAFQQVGATVGAALGGVLVASVGAIAGLGANAITYALSATFLIQIAFGSGQVVRTGTAAARSLRRDLAEGMHYMRTHRPVLEVTLGFLPGNLLLTMVTGFLVVYAAARYGSNPLVFGYLATGIAGGAALGALAIGRWKVRRKVGLLYGVAVVAQSGAVAVLALTDVLAVSLGAVVVLGIVVGLINTAFFATMQAIVPNEVLARVLSIDSVGSFVGIPAGLLIGGLLAARYGVVETYLIAAVGILADGVLLLALPGVRKMGYGPGT
jgi:predicted MFS family arabinose efflux permease